MKTLNNNILSFLKSKTLILVASSFILSSCIIQTGGYSETDGVYYDPNRDSLPTGSYYGGQVDQYYDYSPNIYENNQQNLQGKENRYNDFFATSDSDWGNYTGTETNYYNNNWGWGGGFGWGWGNPYWGGYYGGWNSPFNSWHWGLGFGWGWGASMYSPWGWGGGFYDPFFAYGYGWGGGYYGYPYYNYRPDYRRSGVNGRLTGLLNENAGKRTSNYLNNRNYGNGFRNNSMNNNRNYQNNGFRNYQNNGVRNYPNNGVRNYPNNANSGTRYPNNNNNSIRNYPQNNGGTRNEGFNSGTRSGGFNSGSSGGGFRSGGSGGGFRSGGGGRR